MTVYIIYKSGGQEVDTARKIKVDIDAGTIVLNEGSKQERFFSISLLSGVEIEDRRY